MVDRHVVVARLARIREYVALLRRIRGLAGERQSVPLSRKLARMAGFRNLLVHEYLAIDRRRVYAILRSELGDFDLFIRAVSRRL